MSSDIVDQWAGGHDLPEWFLAAMAEPREDAFIEVDGARVHYFRWGKRGNPPLLMTHGFLAHARCWAFIAPFLADRYDVIAYDLAGMGDSDFGPGGEPDVRAESMVEFAKALDLFDAGTKPIIVAHSFGAGVSLRTMEMAGDHFGGLVMCDLMVLRPERLKAHFEGGGGPPGSGRADKPNKIYSDYDTARSRYVLSPPQPVEQSFLLDYMAYHSMRRVDGGWTWKFDPQVFGGHRGPDDEWLRTPNRMAALPHKLAVIYGEQSALFDDDSADYVRELGGAHIPMIAVPDARHHLMLDQPLAFATALRAVLTMWSV